MKGRLLESGERKRFINNKISFAIMHTQYFHANTRDISRDFVNQEYGAPEDISLNGESSKIKLLFPIRSRNILARLEVPKNAQIHLPQEGTLFSLDNLVSSDDETLTFQTRYFNLVDYVNSAGQLDILKIKKVSPVAREYQTIDICDVTEMDRIGNPQILFNRYRSLLEQITDKERIDSWLDVGYVLQFVDKQIHEWEHGPGKIGKQILDELDNQGFYEGNCTERETLTKWLLSVGGVVNRTIFGQIASEPGMFNGEYHEGRRNGLHAWNELQVGNDKVRYWTPLDDGNMPYLREDSLGVHFIPTNLPQILSKNKSGFADCRLLIKQV